MQPLTQLSRRRFRFILPAAAVLAVVALLPACSSKHSKNTTSSKPISTAPCNGKNGVGSPVPAGLGPGDLVKAVELTETYKTTAGFPTDARAWRILYVSTGVDEHDLQLVCGLVAAPTNGPKTYNGKARMLAWAHGTIGIEQQCLPSNDPAKHFWAPTPDGIGAISWGAKLTGDLHQGKAANGIMQYAINQGWVIAATDYQPSNAYIVGRIAAANVLDSSRAASQLVTSNVTKTAPTNYDLMIAGHSQGGHAAMWAAQLHDSYLAQTTPSKPTANFNLVGVALDAPANNFITDPTKEPGVAFGDGLADSEMHVSFSLLKVQVGPALFSYLFGAWHTLSTGPAPAANAKFPAFPTSAALLNMNAIATSEGTKTVNTVAPLCTTTQAKQINKATKQYKNAGAHQMLTPPLWNLPSNYKTGQYFKGGLDKTCAMTTDHNLQNWCTWLRWNLPGPLGDNPYPKYPITNGKPVPILIAQGSDDQIIHCVPTSGTSSKNVPQPSSCMSRTLYNSLIPSYCPGSNNLGHLQFDVYRHILFQSPASHESIPGQIASASQNKASSGLRFEGSHLQRFMTGAFEGKLAAGCTAQVAN